MAIAQKLAGYSLGQADLLRRAMGKKKKEILDKEFVPFSGGHAANGYSDGAIKTLWDILVPFSDYAFNKAHTAGYGLVSYWTAYLKANYPAEYMAALLTSVRDDKDKSALYLNECRRMGIKVLPPDVNESDADFTPRRHRHPLRPLRDPQRRRQRGRVDRRGPREEGRVHRLQRLPAQGRRRRLQQADRRVADQGRRVRLARPHPARPARRPRARPSTAFIDDQAQRGDRPVRPVRRARRRRAGATPARRDAADPDWRSGTRATLLAYERDMLGLYVSDHPLLGVEHVLARRADCSIGRAHRARTGPTGTVVTVAGLVTRPAAQGHQAGQPVGDRHARGPRGRHRGDGVPADLPAGRHPAGRGRRRASSAAGSTGARTQPKLVAMELTLPDLSDGAARSGRDHAAGRPLHAARGRAAQGGAGDPPGRHRGAPAAASRRGARRSCGSTSGCG